MPGRGFINYSRKLDKVLTLQDMLVPGQEDTFWKTVEESHRAWLISVGMDKDAEFIKTWPFKQSPHVALTYGAVVVKYEVYTIAPYSMGHVELKIPYPRLNGVLKPELFPRPRLKLSSPCSSPASSNAGRVAPRSGACAAIRWYAATPTAQASSACQCKPCTCAGKRRRRIT